MSTISINAGKINQFPEFISAVKTSVTDYKSELATLNKKLLKVDTNFCNLEDVAKLVKASSDTQSDKESSLETFNQSSEQFAEEAAHVDSDAADVINRRKDDFYDEYYYLKPECEKNGWEKFRDGCKKVSEWCKENWIMITTIIVVIATAVVAVVTLGVAVAAIAAIAGLVSLMLTLADVICMIATGGKSISDLCRENGMGWLGQIFDGISIGSDIVSIAFPAVSAIKTMAKVGVKSFVKGSIQAAKFVFKETVEKVFKSGFKDGLKNFGKILFKTFVFDIDDITRINSSGKIVLDIFENPFPYDIPENIVVNPSGLKADGSFDRWPTEIDGFPDGFDGPISPKILEPGMTLDRYGTNYGTFTSPAGTPYANRALSPTTKGSAYTMFKVNNPVEAQTGRIASWFNEPGNGIQFKFENMIINMLKSGDLKIIDYPQITIKGLTKLVGRKSSESVIKNAS